MLDNSTEVMVVVLLAIAGLHPIAMLLIDGDDMPLSLRLVYLVAGLMPISAAMMYLIGILNA